MRANNVLPNDLPHDKGASPFPRNPQAAVSRRALALKRGNERWRAAKANEANMALYARMAAGEEISPEEIAEHHASLERGGKASEKWQDHESRRKERSLNPDKHLAHRRTWCGPGRVKPSIRKHYPPSEAGVLAVIAEDVGRSGRCTRTAKQIAKAVGCGVRTVRRAWATAKELCHLSIEERSVPGRRVNDSNIIRIIDPEWLKWVRKCWSWKPKERSSPTEGIGCPQGPTIENTHTTSSLSWVRPKRETAKTARDAEGRWQDEPRK